MYTYEMFEEMVEAEMIADETRTIKIAPEERVRRYKQRKVAAVKNKGFFAKKKEKNISFISGYYVTVPKTKRALKAKAKRAERAKLNREVASQFDEDIAGNIA